MNTNPIFFNQSFDKKRLKALIGWVLKRFGEKEALSVLEELKRTGFQNATRAGISLGLHELTTPPEKRSLVSNAQLAMNLTDQDFTGGRITATERSQRIVDTWHRVSEGLREQVVQHFRSTDELNPIYIMALSGARGNFSQVKQLVGMRGLMADPQGKIISFPIRSNFREGLTVTEYFISCSGARKGLVDTALRTADTGYLTRRLVDVAHHIVVKRASCRTYRGVTISELRSQNKVLLSLKERLVGRVLAEDVAIDQKCTPDFLKERIREKVLHQAVRTAGREELPSQLGRREFAGPVKIGAPDSQRFGDIIVNIDQEISPDLAQLISLVRRQVVIRSPLTCALNQELCQLCYGWGLAQGSLVSLGEAVGVIAAQSIGEPGTQLTMRTFHTGGVFSGDLLEDIRAPHPGKITFSKAFQGLLMRTAHGKIAFLTKTPGEIVLRTQPSQEMHVKRSSASTESLSSSSGASKQLSRTQGRAGVRPNLKQAQETVLPFPSFSMLFVRQGEQVEKNQLLVEISDLGGEGNQPIQSQQTLFAELSGKVVGIQDGNFQKQELSRGVKQENKTQNQVKPERSARLGLFEILSTRIGATLNPRSSTSQTDFIKSFNASLDREQLSSTYDKNQVEELVRTDLKLLSSRKDSRENNTDNLFDKRNNIRVRPQLKPNPSPLAQTAFHRRAFYTAATRSHLNKEQFSPPLLPRFAQEQTQGWAGTSKGFVCSQPILNGAPVEKMQTEHDIQTTQGSAQTSVLSLPTALLRPKLAVSLPYSTAWSRDADSAQSAQADRLKQLRKCIPSTVKQCWAGSALNFTRVSQSSALNRMSSSPLTGRLLFNDHDSSLSRSGGGVSPFPQSCLYLRTVAENGDLVNEDYKECTHSSS